MIGCVLNLFCFKPLTNIFDIKIYMFYNIFNLTDFSVSKSPITNPYETPCVWDSALPSKTLFSIPDRD